MNVANKVRGNVGIAVQRAKQLILKVYVLKRMFLAQREAGRAPNRSFDRSINLD